MDVPILVCGLKSEAKPIPGVETHEGRCDSCGEAIVYSSDMDALHMCIPCAMRSAHESDEVAEVKAADPEQAVQIYGKEKYEKAMGVAKKMFTKRKPE